MLILAAAVAFPAILFYTILFRHALNVPLFDDYDALLAFLNQMAELRTGPAKASYFLVAQHNEYKLFFERGLAWLELIFSGHIDLRFLCALGNGFVLLLGILLWKMFLPNHKNLASRLAFFVPISWLLFQFQYIGTLNWAMGSLQNFPVLFFSLGAIYLLVRETRWGFCAALAFLVLAIASSGNGLLLVPIGMLILVANHSYVRVMGWLAVSAGCVGAYAYHYNTMSSQSPVHDSIFAALMGLRLLFVIAFIGNAAAFPLNQQFSRRWGDRLPFPWSRSLHLLFLPCAERVLTKKSTSLVLRTVSVANGSWCRRSSVGPWPDAEPLFTLWVILCAVPDFCVDRNR